MGGVGGSLQMVVGCYAWRTSEGSAEGEQDAWYPNPMASASHRESSERARVEQLASHLHNSRLGPYNLLVSRLSQ